MLTFERVQPIGDESLPTRDGIRNTFESFSFFALSTAVGRSFIAEFTRLTGNGIAVGQEVCRNGPLADEVRTRKLRLERPRS